ncbi:MAG: Uma2 family endonuclease [Bacteroidota bacterium]
MFDSKSQPPSNPLAVIKPQRKPRLYTLGEFLRKEARSKYKHQYINGKIEKMPGARGPHNIIASNINYLLQVAIEKLEEEYIVFSSDQLIYMPKLNFGYYADTLAVCEKPVYWNDNNVLLTNPLLIVEILSKSTQKRDRTSKFEDYKTLDSFKEYVLVRQDICSVETRFREEPDLWREKTVNDRKDEVRLRSLGCSISMEGIYKNIDFE